MGTELDENLSLKMIGLAATAFFANDKLVEIFDTSNKTAMENKIDNDKGNC